MTIYEGILILLGLFVLRFLLPIAVISVISYVSDRFVSRFNLAEAIQGSNGS
jgi:hypothetical protein